MALLQTFQLEILLLVTGLIAGYINVMAGGGSLLTVPVMLFAGIPAPVANGTSRIGVLFQTLTAVITFAHKGFKDFKLSLLLAICTLPGAILGAYYGTRLEGVWFNRLVAVVMVFVMIAMTTSRPPKQQQYKPQNIPLACVMMVGVGFYGGIIQMGAGFILMPILQRVLGLSLVHVNMHKVFIVMTYSIVALLVFMSQTTILWTAGLALAAGTSTGAWIGTRMMIKSGDRLIKIIFNIVLVIFLIKLLFF